MTIPWVCKVFTLMTVMCKCAPRVLGPELLSQLWQSCDVTADSKKLSDSLDEVIPRHKSCIELMLVHVIADIITAFSFFF